MEAVQTAFEQQGINELIRELISLDPPANLEYLIQALDIFWFDRSIANQLVTAIGKRSELHARHLIRIIERRDAGGPIKAICELLLEHEPNINDLRFTFDRVPASRKRIATLFSNHPDATYSDLAKARACEDLEPGCREQLDQRIEEVRNSGASVIIQRIKQLYAGYRSPAS